LREYGSAHEVYQDTAHTVLSDERLSGTGSSSAEINVKEYGDAERIGRFILVLPELQERSCGLKNEKNQIKVMCNNCGARMSAPYAAGDMM
jgi:hypothetical protein